MFTSPPQNGNRTPSCATCAMQVFIHRPSSASPRQDKIERGATRQPACRLHNDCPLQEPIHLFGNTPPLKAPDRSELEKAFCIYRPKCHSRSGLSRWQLHLFPLHSYHSFSVSLYPRVTSHKRKMDCAELNAGFVSHYRIMNHEYCSLDCRVRCSLFSFLFKLSRIRESDPSSLKVCANSHSHEIQMTDTRVYVYLRCLRR